MNENVRIGAAALGGYVLGRTKKGKAAVSLAMWLTGHNYRVKDVARDRVVGFLQSAEGERLLAQLRGPAAEAGRRAAFAIYERQADRFADNLRNRTDKLKGMLQEPGQGSEPDDERDVEDVDESQHDEDENADLSDEEDSYEEDVEPEAPRSQDSRRGRSNGDGDEESSESGTRRSRKTGPARRGGSESRGDRSRDRGSPRKKPARTSSR